MINLERNVMNAIKMKRLELLDIVRANKEKHIAEYVEAVSDYKTLVIQIASSNLKLAKSGDLEQIKRTKGMPQLPQSFEDSYKRAIRMLELSVEDIIEVEEDVFNQLVLDEWQWKRSFTASAMSYKTGAF